ncbi:TonB-dependent receptor [bacterium]|nr:TonB-dependent receptor [bacterium]
MRYTRYKFTFLSPLFYKLQTILIAIFLLLQSIPGYSQDAKKVQLAELYKMSLEELMNVKVTTTTKSEISINKCPGIVRVFTNKDFEKYGLTTLRDVLSFIPGIQIQEYMTGVNLVWIRGVQSRYNSKVLLFIDGVPVRDSYYGSFCINEAVTLNNIERIEVINGPGSVLYGANAFAGIIYITTKSNVNIEPDEKTHFSINSNGGFGKSWGDIEGKYEKENKYYPYTIGVEGSGKGFYGYGEYFYSKGFNPELTRDGTSFEHDQHREKKYFMLKYKRSNFSFMGTINDYYYPYTAHKSDRDQRLHRIPVYGTVSYKKDFKNMGKFNIQAYYNYIFFKRYSFYFLDEGVPQRTLEGKKENFNNTILYGIDCDYLYQWQKHLLTLGFSYQHDESEKIKSRTINYLPSYEKGEWKKNIEDDVKRNNIGIFIQDLWEINSNLILTTGIRYNTMSRFDDQFNYRLGLTGQKNKFYGKLLYGSAYRVPVYREYLKVGVINKELQPEHLNTFEIQAGYTFTKGNFNLTFFTNSYRDFIEEISITVLRGDTLEGSDEYNLNFKSRNISGLEFNSVLYPVNNLSIILAASYLLSAKEEMGGIPNFIVPEFEYDIKKHDLYFLSKFTFNLLTSYRIFKKYNLGVNLIYYSHRNKPKEYQTCINEEDRRPQNADAFTKVDVFTNFRFKKTFFELKINNIFNSRIYSPPFAKIANYDTEWPGRVLIFSIKHTF